MGNPYQKVIDRVRGEKWSQRQDSTVDQLKDVLPLIHAIGCYDAGDLIRGIIQQAMEEITH